ncbi:hypothetical protein GPECTOR_769g942 [Gonium pectorale]|uniref:Uncharacterized protein n=1 Tax=Gonium pectorale TaxID=33097 RepID=A0A150FU29_GONPE|nr:hypothetical protein GPECTOR_769g942 [Gonium pectorale]|eukprot:KXZ41119.1 hypothetical protein GPECTOR_769g942 [Gonium pectorale]
MAEEELADELNDIDTETAFPKECKRVRVNLACRAAGQLADIADEHNFREKHTISYDTNILKYHDFNLGDPATELQQVIFDGDPTAPSVFFYFPPITGQKGKWSTRCSTSSAIPYIKSVLKGDTDPREDLYGGLFTLRKLQFDIERASVVVDLEAYVGALGLDTFTRLREVAAPRADPPFNASQRAEDSLGSDNEDDLPPAQRRKSNGARKSRAVAEKICLDDTMRRHLTPQHYPEMGRKLDPERDGSYFQLASSKGKNMFNRLKRKGK